MRKDAFAGKGGVGKTALTVSTALYSAVSGQKTAIIDYDGGHSVLTTLGINTSVKPNEVVEVGSNLSVAVLENVSYVDILEAKQRGWKLEKYLDQFHGQWGITPWPDMLNRFFGVPVDVPSLHRFVALVTTMATLKRGGYANVVIDVEPTAGLERMLLGVGNTIRSFRNLRDQWGIVLAALSRKWPDIAGYLKQKNGFVKNIDRYSGDMEDLATALKEANFFLVCTPEESPVNQTFVIKAIVEKFGGTISGVAVNNTRGEAHERGAIAKLALLATTGTLPVVLIPHTEFLHGEAECRQRVLLEIGGRIHHNLIRERQ